MVVAIIRDPIEETKEYAKAMEKIEPILDREFPKNQCYMGMCHRYWYRKKMLLEEEGIHWRSPSEMNPDTRFD